MTIPNPSLSHTFTGLIEVPLHPNMSGSSSMAFMPEDNPISGLGTVSINQSNTTAFDQGFASPTQPLNSFQEACRGAQYHSYWNTHGEGPSTLPLYDLPTEADNPNFEFPSMHNSFHLTDSSGRYPNRYWF
jgi:hypothetical protein